VKNNYILFNIKYFVGTQKFKMIILVLIINALYGGFVLAQPGITKGYVNALFAIYTNPYFLMILLSMILLNTMYIRSLISENFEYRIRLNDEKNYLRNLVKNVTICNSIIFIVELILILTIINLFYSSSSGIYLLKNGINSLLYIIFFISKVYILIYFLNTINIYILKNINQYIVVIVNLIFFVSLPSDIDLYIFKNNFIEFPLYISTYFRIYPYESFMAELSSTILFVAILKIIILVIKNIKFNKNKE